MSLPASPWWGRGRSPSLTGGAPRLFKSGQRRPNGPYCALSGPIALVVKMVVAALTAFLTALTTTSCMGRGPLF
ncbi:MAG: hypothetical protein ILA06_08810 [Bacteroidaceae bacterium]|nr:hypothetical protein [Bacteroidaceae bacterium]